MRNYTLGYDRLVRVTNAANKYINNIRRQQDYAGNDRQARIALYSGRYSKSQEIDKQNNSRQYSRSTYMGLSNG